MSGMSLLFSGEPENLDFFSIPALGHPVECGLIQPTPALAHSYACAHNGRAQSLSGR